MSALGLPLDAVFLATMVDFGVPVFVTVFWMQTVRKLPTSRERTVLLRTGWAFFIFLFVWWVGVRPALFGSY